MPSKSQIIDEIRRRCLAVDGTARSARVIAAAVAAVEACFDRANGWEPLWDKKRADRRQRAWFVRNRHTGEYHRGSNRRAIAYEFEHSAISVARRLNGENSV